MSKNFSITFRKNVISFAITWIGLLIVIGIVSLFSIWSMNKSYKEGAKLASQINQTSFQITSAQVDFKIQVQEWKNILLRGKNISDREKYLSSFQNQEKNVNDHLDKAGSFCSQNSLNIECEKIAAIQTEHKRLYEIYQNTLLNASFDNYEAIHQIDDKVRGIDRNLDTSMDLLSSNLLSKEANQQKETLGTLVEKYNALRKFILVFMFIALTISSISLYSILRTTRE